MDYHRISGLPVDDQRPVILTLPPLGSVARQFLFTLCDATTGELIDNVVAFDIHFDANAAPGEQVWLVAEQLLDRDLFPCRAGARAGTTADLSAAGRRVGLESAMLSGLFRYRLKHFEHSRRDESAAPEDAGAAAVVAESAPCQAQAPTGPAEHVRVFHVRLQDPDESQRVVGSHFAIEDGAYVFYGADGLSRVAAFSYPRVRSVAFEPHTGTLQLTGEELSTIAASLRWDLVRMGDHQDKSPGSRHRAVSDLICKLGDYATARAAAA